MEAIAMGVVCLTEEWYGREKIMRKRLVASRYV